ncbi:MAG: hypothetical protein ACWA5L_11070 [bacterium]
MVVRNGDWGWGGERGCAHQSDMIRFDSDKVVLFFNNGEEVTEGRLLERSVKYDQTSQGTAGKVKGVEWQILLKEPNMPDNLLIKKYNFSYTGLIDQKALLLNTIEIRKRQNGAWDKKWTRIKNRDNPRRGKRLHYCQEQRALSVQDNNA